MLALGWLTTGVAFHAIQRRQIAAHRDRILRSYIVTFAFVTFRYLIEFPPTMCLRSVQDLVITSIRACWTPARSEAGMSPPLMLGNALRHQIIAFLYSKRDRQPDTAIAERPLQGEARRSTPILALADVSSEYQKPIECSVR